MAHNQELLQKLGACAAACEMCADACLGEDDIKKMVRCIRLDRDCAKICYTTASFVASHSEHTERLIKECEELCRMCAEECEQHEMDHCRECAKACRECEEACKSFSGVGV
ncbi:four-helix bundle copper-binding protein [Marivirga sp. S37H4]|uniref:Four-helix bundle copper-binding protein n=1 Tax=Marivirga aurantiaca TaxID=2802615 RepID=A0A935CAH4_9BACT|nr:four-helix bundle copper-binding protein [Marivirga aurantiaca]MBK6266202.1 four-helix bundle copper-binding protein [Marivirga aurantiaca]